MKLAKKFMTLALATALGVGCATVGVSAAGSRTSAITVSAEQSAIYEVVQKIEETEGFADLQAELPAVADAFKQVNEGKMEVAGFVDVLKTLAEETTDEEVKLLSKNSLRNSTEKISLQVLMNSKYLMQTKQRRMLMANTKLRLLFQASQILWKTSSL